MKNDWEITKLGDICTKITDGTHSTPTYLPDGVPFLSVKNLTKGIIDLSNTKFISVDEHKFLTRRCKPEREDILYTKVGTTGIAKVVDIDDEFSIFVSVALLKINHEKIYNKYLEHFLNAPFAREQAQKRTRGMANKNLVITDIKEIEIHFPKSLTEQQRIVAILDEAFAAIAQAKENAEKNLQNARELFDSYLQSVFANPGDGWEEKRFDEICVLQRGFDLPTRLRNAGDFPLVSSNGITDRIDLWKVKAPGVVTGRSGTIGNIHFIEEDYFPLNTALYIKEFHGNYERFVYYFLKQFDLNKYSSGAGVPTLNRNNVHIVRVYFPKSIIEQKNIVEKLDALSAETKKLENIYRQKINDLDELKKSILQKAFNGELTASNRVSNVIEFSVRIPNISTTDLQAGIVAIAHQRHQEKGKVLTFGHVKAEKIAHLAESFLGIELDRNPVKDAAGPNDFPHLKKVESRAEKAGFFKTIKQGYGHEYIQLSQFDNLIEKTKTALDDKAAKLTDLIDLLVPMDTQQAELIATVYAAWNNLLIDNLTINDEAIVTEARENWHEAKMNIPRERFFKTIIWLKEQNLIPHGKGKKVSARPNK